MFNNSDMILLCDYETPIYNADGSILLRPKKRVKNDSFRADAMSQGESEFKSDGQKLIDLAMYRLCNNWRADSDSLKLNPPEYQELPNVSDRLDAAHSVYLENMTNAWKD